MRPTKYKPEYCDKLIQHMSEGLSYESFAAVISVNRDTLYNWEKVHQEFFDAKKEGFSQNLLFWEKAGLAGMADKSFNSTVWIFNMKNRHMWKDKQEIDQNQNISINIDKEDSDL